MWFHWGEARESWSALPCALLPTLSFDRECRRCTLDWELGLLAAVSYFLQSFRELSPILILFGQLDSSLYCFSDVNLQSRLCFCIEFTRVAAMLFWCPFVCEVGKQSRHCRDNKREREYNSHFEVHYSAWLTLNAHIDEEWLRSALQLDCLLLCLLLQQFPLGFHLSECCGTYLIPCRFLWYQFYHLNL